MKLEVKVDKRFGTREVLRQATISVGPGTVHALCGENGAGKSTLVKIIAGVIKADAGRLKLAFELRPPPKKRDEPMGAGGSIESNIASWTRQAARTAGIGIVQQHGAFAPTLSVVENAVLGVEPTRGPLLDLGATADALRTLGTKIGLEVDPWARADELSLGAAQRAEIVAALHQGAKLLILDEPTAVLAPIEVEGLLATLRQLAADGTSIIIVTHKLDEVRAVADEVTVLRAGETVATFSASTDPARFDVRAIARAMVGAEPPDAGTPPALVTDATPALVLEQVGVGSSLHAIDLAVRRGELVGVAGVDGNGQRELALAIAGLVRHTGKVVVGTRDLSRATPRARLAAGLAHIPEDRHHGGLVLDATVGENISLGRRDITGRFVVDRARVARAADDGVRDLDIRPPDPHAIARALSGGNQQKIVIARELSRPELAVVLAAQPTRGVDLGAVARIHDRLRAAAAAGAGVLVISADLDELLALCHRVVVLLRGRIVGEHADDALRAPGTRASLGAMMTGAAHDAEVTP